LTSGDSDAQRINCNLSCGWIFTAQSSHCKRSPNI